MESYTQSIGEISENIQLSDPLNIGVGIEPPIAVTVEGWGRQIQDIRSIRAEEASEEELARKAVRQSLQLIPDQTPPRRVQQVSDSITANVRIPERITTAGLVYNHVRNTVSARLPDDVNIDSTGEYPTRVAEGFADFGANFVNTGFVTPRETNTSQVAKKSNRILLFTDASYKHPVKTERGEYSGYGYVITTPDGLVIDMGGGAMDAKNSMVAEAKALYTGLARVADFDDGNVVAHMDTDHIPMNFDSKSTFKDEKLNTVIERCHSALYEFDSFRAKRIPREMNAVADFLARRGRYAPIRLRQTEEDGKIKTTTTKYSTS